MIFNYNQETLEKTSAIYTSKEIFQQPETWKKTIAQVKDEANEIKEFVDEIITKEDFDIILTGAGTSEFVGNSLYAYLGNKFDYKVKSYATTDLVATPEKYLSQTKPTLLISFGRSGNSPESIGAVEVADVVCQNIKHLFVTCNHDGALSKAAKTRANAYAINLTPETHDLSFAMTSSFSNMYLATMLALQTDKIDELAMQIEAVCDKTQLLLDDNFDYFKDLVSEYKFNRIVYLGSNSLKGIAQESALKMLELTAGDVVTMFDSPLGFRHGPKSIINDDTLTVVYLSDDYYTYQYERDLIKEMSAQRKGNRILAISNDYRQEIADLTDYYYAFKNNPMDNVFLGLSYIVTAQMIALFKSLDLNITPDNPCPSGEVNRVVKGVTLYPYTKGE